MPRIPSLAVLFVTGCAAQFLADAPPKALLLELKDLLGENHLTFSPQRLVALQQDLSDLFAALPKNSRGSVRPAAARYALHRLLVQRHGWQFSGLELGGDSWDSSSPTAALGNRVPEDVAQLFESRLTEHGLDLSDLATLAAMLENMVHAEADVRLAAAYRALNLPLRESLDLQQSTQVLEAYMASFVLGADMQHLQPENIRTKLSEVPEQYPTWPATQTFLQDVRHEVAPTANFSFQALSEVVAAVGERYGKWQSHECSHLKEELLQSEEHPNTGRVRLSDFYSQALHGGKWQFSESVSYLRQLGALDESDPEVIRVIVPNYILGPSNCIASSGYYAVCCIDECDAYLRGLEDKLKSHQASPEAILAAVNRSVAPSLQRRLREVAAHHGGQVPLHGRLFSQWLHHLHPRECPYPHMSGTTSPLRPEIFEEQVGESVGASEEEMMQHVESAGWRKAPSHEEGMCSNMWTMEEELVDSLSTAEPVAVFGTRAAARGLALATAVVSLVVTLAKILTSARPETLAKPAAPKIYSV
mmetsp:Transcript_25449/g.60691  ORF Transcript_25449/g.60691 Transcript_25449/m.60691 type:complete len:532 (+) Transcript_25449:103-1698(+)